MLILIKLVKIKANSKYLTGYFDKDIRPLISKMSKISGYITSFKVED